MQMNHRVVWLWLCLAAAPLVTPRAQAAHNYEQWEKEVAAYERDVHTNPPPKGALLFTGSSTIRFWKTLAADFPRENVINRGFGGSEIADATYFAPRLIIPSQPKVVLLRAGGNDLHNGKSVAAVFNDYKEFAGKVHASLPAAQIVFIGLCPSIARWDQHQKEKELNGLVEEYSRSFPYLKYIESYDLPLDSDGQPLPALYVQDKLHFSPAGYKLLAAKVRAFLSSQGLSSVTDSSPRRN
jgi:lysophospholipase L1-like esterase